MKRYNLKNLYKAKIISRHQLNKKGSIKNTYHLVIDIEGSEMRYSPGDCLGVMPENDKKIVSLCIKHMQGNENDTICIKKNDQSLSLIDYLTKKANITKVTPKLLHLLMNKASNGDKKNNISSLLDDKTLLNNYLKTHELWDILEEFFSLGIRAQEICDCLLPLLPRLYSISSAYEANPREVHLTVAKVMYETSNKKRHGVASTYLCEIAQKNINIYIHPTKKFFLPKDPNTPIIMVGTGAGIAPFICFLQDRYSNNPSGENWLFFGECNKAYDFYYEDYLCKLQNENFLKLSLAFSRDQKEKIYVQHRLLEEKEKIWEWITTKKAIFYVCGDAKRMAKDVDNALLSIFKEKGDMSDANAAEYLHLLVSEKRYLKDVY